MQAEMMSVITGTEECIAKCPFCVSCEKVGSVSVPSINLRNFRKVCAYAEKAGVTTIELTSRGEPLLYPDMITAYLEELSNWNFPFIELQTNAILIGNRTITERQLLEWYNLGLTHIAISTVSVDKKVNARNYLCGEYRGYPDLHKTVDLLHDIGFTVRLVCVMCNDLQNVGYVCTPEQVETYIKTARSWNVEQVTLRPLNLEFRREDARDWCSRHILTENQKSKIVEYLEKNGSVIRTIDKVGVVYDLQGQNVMLSIPMDKTTPNSDSNSTRQLIFFPDGRLRYEWEKMGAILL